MQIFKRRPLALACFAFLCTLILCFYIRPIYKLILFTAFAAVLVLAVIIFIRLKRARNTLLALILSALFALSAVLSSYFGFEKGYYELQEYVGTAGEIEAVVTKINFCENFASYLEINVSSINGERADTKMKLECTYSFPYEVGERFSAEVDFVALEENINGYPEKMIGISKGQSLTAVSDSFDDLVFLGEADFNIFLFADELNLALDAILDKAIGKESSGLSRAILLGNKDALSAAEDRDIRYVGVSHLLALSGMHLTILIGNIGLLLSYLGVPKRPRLLILAVLTSMYVVLTGMQMSMIRSAIMLFMAYLGFFIGRNREMLTSLFFSVALMCMVCPEAVFDIGLQLSFLSMLGMVVFQETLEDFFEKLLGKLRSDILYLCIFFVCMSFSVTLIANLAVLPAIWFYFGETSLISVIGNFLLAPFADLILMLSPFVILLFKVPVLGPCTAWCVGRLSNIMLDICAFLSEPRGVMMSLRYPFAMWIILGLSGILFVMLVVKIERKRTFIIPVLSAFIAFVICLGAYNAIHKGELRGVHITDTNNDGFTLVSNGRTLICDISSGAYSFDLSLVLAGKELAVCDVDTYLLTHYHDRHVDTLSKLCDQIYIRNLLLPLPANENEKEILTRIIDMAEDKKVNVRFYDPENNNSIVFENITIDIGQKSTVKRSVHPITALSFSNENSRVTYIGSSVNECDLYESFLPAVKDSEIVVFGVHGPKIKSPFSYGALSPSLKSVIFSSDEVLGAIDPLDTSFVSSLENSRIEVGRKVSYFAFD